MTSRRISLRLSRTPAVTIEKGIHNASELVYAIRVDQKLAYPFGRSRVVYFGKTDSGVDRVVTSAGERCKDIFNILHVNSIDIHIIDYDTKNASGNSKLTAAASLALERCLLGTFTNLYGCLPLLNVAGYALYKRKKLYSAFSEARIHTIIDDLA